MAKFIKHVGKHGDRKVAIVFRQIPGEDHMCLVVYTETLNQNIHDPMITCIESPQGQASENLGDALNRTYTKDGQQILQVVHREGMMKKVQTNQIMVTPAPNQKIKLSELNDILNEMAKGEDAVRKLAEIDASRGLQDPKDVAKRMRGESTLKNKPTTASILGNTDIASDLRQQALKMAGEAKGLMAEADRLLKEAAQINPITAEKPKARRTTKKEVVVEAPVASVKPSRARKAKVAG